MGLLDRIKKMAFGGDLGETEPEVTSDPSAVNAAPLLNDEEMAFEISESYLKFLDDFNENLYLSDLLVYKNKKDLMKRDRLYQDDILEDDKAIELAAKGGFYDQLKQKPYYENLPIKEDLLKWLPDVKTLSGLKININQGGANVQSGNIPLSDSLSISGDANIGKGGINSGNVKITKRF